MTPLPDRLYESDDVSDPKPLNGRTDERLRNLESRGHDLFNTVEVVRGRLGRMENWSADHDGWVIARWKQYDVDLARLEGDIQSLTDGIDSMRADISAADKAAAVASTKVAMFTIGAQIIIAAAGVVVAVVLTGG